MYRKRLTALFLIISFILSMGTIPVNADRDITIKSFNATSSAVIVDLDTTNDILTDSIEDNVKLYAYENGENTEVNSTVTVTKNSLVITPAMGVEMNKYYFVEISEGVCDSADNAVERVLRTNWFTVEIIYSENFDAVFDDELNPVDPYYYDTNGTTMKHSGWIVDNGERNSITLPGKVPSITKENGTDTVLGFNNGGFAVLDNNTLPADYTVEYVYNFPLSYNYANTAYATHRMRVGAPNKNNINSGIGIKFGNDHNKSAHTSTVELVIAGYSGDLSTYKYEEYNFGSETINARISAVGDHFQWFSDNVKLFDISGIPAGSGTVAFVDGCWPNQGMPYIDDVVITKYTDMGPELPSLSITDCTASDHRVTIEFCDEVDESTLAENIVVYKDSESFDNYSVSAFGNFAYIDLPENDGSFYRIDISKGICSSEGFALGDVAQYEFEDTDGSLIYRVIQKPEIDDVSVVLLNDTREIKVTYDFTANYAECTSYEISTSTTAGGVYTTAFSGEINDAQLIVGGGDIFKDKYIKITLHPTDSHGYLGDIYVVSDVYGFMSPKVSDIVISGKVEEGAVSITSYSFSDENSDNNVSEIVWLVADTPDGTYTPLEDENSEILTITDELYNKFIKAQITAKSDKYPVQGNVITSDVISRVFKPVANDVKIIGESLVGKTLTPHYKYYDYNGKDESGTLWKWMISDTLDGTYLAIGADNQPSYKITNDDIGRYLKLCVVPAKEGVTGDTFYSEVFVLPALPQALNVAVSGTAEYGYTVAGKYDYFQAGGVKEKDSIYAWYVNDELVSNEKNYTIKKSDAGKSLVFEVTPKAEKEPVVGTTVKSVAVTIAKIKTFDGGKGSSNASSSGGAITIGDLNKVMNDINTATMLTEQNISKYITAFTDISDSKYIKQIVYLSDLDIIKGTSATTFDPKRSITRAEAAALICRALNLNSSQKDYAYFDVSANAWYAGYINSITDKGFMCGYNGLFRPEDVITVEEMTKIMIMVYESEFEPVEVYEGTKLPNDASDWSCEYLKKALELGWFNNALSVHPLENVIREDAAYLLYNAMGLQ